MLMTIQMQNNFLFLKRKIWLFLVLCYQPSATRSPSPGSDSWTGVRAGFGLNLEFRNQRSFMKVVSLALF